MIKIDDGEGPIKVQIVRDSDIQKLEKNQNPFGELVSKPNID